MQPLKESILGTLAYYDVLEYPLSLLEIHRYLVNPQRIYSISEPVGDISISSVLSLLDQLVKEGNISEKYGLYFLPGRDFVVQRIEREKISAQKWKRLLKIGYWFQAVPYLRGMFVSGSMAIDNANEKSDLDILVITEPKRMYTSRMLLSFLASILRARRKRYDTEASNKFCFNHYITSDSLRISHESIYNGETYATLKMIFGSESLYQDFYRANVWINKYVYHFRPDEYDTLRKIQKNRFLLYLAKIGEWILDSKLGDFIESRLKKYQQGRIRKNPATHASGGRIIYSDMELEFHPRSFERKLIDQYNKTISSVCGSLALPEKDSGLT